MVRIPGFMAAGQPAEKSRFYYLSDSNVTKILAFIGGFVDAAGYLKLQGVFTSSITGNLVVACASVSSLTGVICRSSVCIAFTLAGGLLSLLAIELKLSFHCSQGTISMVLFCFEALTLIIVWIIGLELVSHQCKCEILLPSPVGSVRRATAYFVNRTTSSPAPNDSTTGRWCWSAASWELPWASITSLPRNP